MRMIGRYRVHGLLGRGGMSVVYKVSMPVLGRIVALKLLSPPELLRELISVGDLKKIFTTEAMTMASLRHENIADIRDFDSDEQGNPFYIMEYYCNNLGVMIGEHYRVEETSRILDPEKIFQYGSEILDGLGCLHHAGIVHRDIKPYNILITDQDTPKICDFGLSRVRGETFPSAHVLNVGSPYYAAPEQIADPESADQRADLFSVGVMLFRMATGRLPEKSLAASEINTLLDRKWDAFFSTALAADKQGRFSDASAMNQALQDLESHWRIQKELACDYHTPTREDQESPDAPMVQRSEPMLVPVAAARKTLGLDQLWRPVKPLAADLVAQKEGTILDRKSGLLWQRSGSAYPLTWDTAQEYVRTLNDRHFAGRTGWRLPTVPELVSLIQEKSTTTDYCIAPLFDRRQKSLWTSDRRSRLAAWYVSVDLGFVAWQDITCFYHVRAVCSPMLRKKGGETEAAGRRRENGGEEQVS